MKFSPPERVNVAATWKEHGNGDYQRVTCGEKERDAQISSWLVVWNILFPYIGNNDPNSRTHIFQRDGSTTNQSRFITQHDPIK